MGFISDAKSYNKKIIVAGVEYDYARQEFVFKNTKYTLDPKSTSLFELLLNNPDKTLSSHEILISIWNNEFISKNVVTNRIGMIRSFFCKNFGSGMEDVIMTYPRKGYSIKRGAITLIDTAIYHHEDKDTFINDGGNELTHEVILPSPFDKPNETQNSSAFSQRLQALREFNLTLTQITYRRLLLSLLLLLLCTIAFLTSAPHHTKASNESNVSRQELRKKDVVRVMFNSIHSSSNTSNISELELCYRLINAASNFSNMSVVNLYSPRFFTGAQNQVLCPGSESNKSNKDTDFNISIILNSSMMQLLIQHNINGKQYHHEIELTDINSMATIAAHHINMLLESLEVGENKQTYHLTAPEQQDEYRFSMQSRMIANGGHDEMLGNLIDEMMAHEKYRGLSFENKSWLLFLLAYNKRYDDALSMYHYFQNDDALKNPLLSMVLAYVAYEKKDYSLSAYHHFSAMALLARNQQALATQCFLSNDEGQTCARLWRQLLNQKSAFWEYLIGQYCKMVVDIRNKSS
ncbi:transcriptional regulator [Aeromonas sp. S12(2024)]|uniref:winged helix-turn-helix domain-containing protein n=1 Tax=Aeromonas sp. S12(2024) TaxID=3242885 RepID=UPI003527F01A